jgi:hypothetical protein
VRDRENVFYAPNDIRALLAVFPSIVILIGIVVLNIAITSGYWPLVAILLVGLGAAIWMLLFLLTQHVEISDTSVSYSGVRGRHVIPLSDIHQVEISRTTSGFSSGFTVELKIGETPKENSVLLKALTTWKKDNPRLVEIATTIRKAVPEVPRQIG